MRASTFLSTAAAVCAAASLQAQNPGDVRIGGQVFGPGGFGMVTPDMPRAVIGVGTSSGATSRDTIGVLVSTVRAGSPAEKAGIEEGNRIASINGVNLKLSAADIGDEQMAGVISRRLNRELDKLKPSDEVDLRIYAGGQTKALKVKTVSPDSLYGYSSISSSRRYDERATLGINLSMTGTSRDTIGVLVMSVEDGSPAAKAGIEEGSRIATINGVDVRGKAPNRDDDDRFFRPTNLSRIEREMERMKPGDNVDLKIYYNGQFRNVKATATRLSDLPRRNRTVTITNGDNIILPRAGRVDPIDISSEVRRALESARVIGRMGGTRIEW
jgi:S1-C subfamily serine protease